MPKKESIGKLSLQDYEQLLEKAAEKLEVSIDKAQHVIYNIGLTSGEPIDEKRMLKFIRFAKAARSSVPGIRKAAETPGLIPPWLVKQAGRGKHRAFYQKWFRAIKNARVSMMEYYRIVIKLSEGTLPFGDEKNILRLALETDERRLEFDRILKLKRPKELYREFFQKENDFKVPLGENYHPSVGWY